MRSDAPQGLRYSSTYIERGAPTEDSARARRRLAAYVKDELYEGGPTILSHLEKELGTESRASYAHLQIAQIITDSSPITFLDAVTEIYRANALAARRTQSQAPARRAKSWRDFVARVFAEERLAFEVDAACGIHPLVDQAYVSDRTAVLAGLGDPRFASALVHYEAAMDRFSGADPELGPAIREVFLAAEAVFKTIFPQSPRLEVAEINKRLKSTLSSSMGENEQHAVGLCLTAFGNWVSAAHHYRHADREAEPPSLTTAVLMISMGSVFIRWLAEYPNASGD